MTRFGKIAAFAGALFLAVVGFAAPASAQATRTWVSGVGDDVNPCSRTAPCKTFAGAISKTAAGGEIDVLDPGGFGAVTITKSITIDGSPGSIGSILVSSTNGVVINAAGAVVTLRNLSIEGIGNTSSTPGLRGVSFLNGASLLIQDTVIRGFRDATNGWGVSFTPSGAATLTLSNVQLSSNGNGTVGGGVLVQPTGTGSAKVTLNRVVVDANGGSGLRVDTAGNTGTGLNVVVADSQFTNNAVGVRIQTPASTSNATVTLTRSTIAHNSNIGLLMNGSAAISYSSGSTITDNTTGVATGAGGAANSFGDNVLIGNATNGAFTGAVVPKS